MSLAYDLCYITTKIHTETPIDAKTISTGESTGFFVTFKTSSGDKLCLVTNRHVVEGKRMMSIYLNPQESNGEPVDNKLIIHIFDFLTWKKNVDYYFHPQVNPINGKPYDLCVIPFEKQLPLIEAKYNTKIYIKSFNEELFMTNGNKSSLDSLEDILMVGYPYGLWDSANNRPLFRKGITATDPKVDYNNSKMFLIDCACIQGSSGSPVMQYKDGLKAKVSGESLNLTDEVDHMLLGIQQSIPTGMIEATIDSSSGTTSTLQSGEKISIKIPLNLGYILKAELLLDIKSIINW